MKIFLVILTISALVFAAWASDQIARLLETDPTIVLIFALVLLGVVVAYIMLKPRSPEPTAAERDPRAWLHPEQHSRAVHGNRNDNGASWERAYDDSRGVTWWKHVDQHGRETWARENHGENIARNDEKLRNL